MPRLRQVALVATDIETSAAALIDALGLTVAPFVDPGVAEFGLRNLVFEVGDCFVELLTPTVEGTAGGRHLERHGGDAAYMAIFQLDDLDSARDRTRALGVRTVWTGKLDDIEAMHLHPSDTGGALVSLDRPMPPESWRWAGPRWTGSAPPDASAGGITSLVVEATDPAAVAARWAAILGVALDPSSLDLGEQQIRFVRGATGRIVDVGLRLPGNPRSAVVAGTRLTVGPM